MKALTRDTSSHRAQSAAARQQLDLRGTTVPSSLCSGRGQPVQPGQHRAAVKAALTQCVFVNEPDDEVGQGLNSCGDGSATARRLQLQRAETHYE